MTTSNRIARALLLVLAASALACVARPEEPAATSGQGTSDVATGGGQGGGSP